MPQTYQPAIIQEVADRLYAQARDAIALGGILGGILGLALGGVLGSTIGHGSDGFFVAIVLGVVVGAVGVGWGYSRALALRFQAQTALCQAQIEANTRYIATALSQRGG